MGRYISSKGNPNDINLRQEITKVIQGSDEEFARGKYVLLRQMKRDANGNLLYCHQCTDKGSKGHSLVHVCDVCWGVGYIWEEKWVKVYEWAGNTPPRTKANFNLLLGGGSVDRDIRLFYMTPGIEPSSDDWIIEVSLDIEGSVVQPTKRVRRYEIKDIDELRLDSGRLEYYKIVAVMSNIGFIGQPINQMNKPKGALS